MLDHGVSNFEHLDRKAIGVIAGVGAVATFLSGKLHIAGPPVAAAFVLTLFCAGAASGCAVP